MKQFRLGLLSEPDFRVSYTDADTIKAVAEEKLQGVLTELQTNGPCYAAEQ
jgi:hypothetical protein